MNLPNILTLSRIGFAFILVYLLLLNSLTGNIWAAIFFTAASLTDFYDGYLAKKKGLISDFGKIMDPISDKVLMLSVFFVLAHIGMVLWWMVIMITVREIGVTVDRLWSMRRGQVLGAERAGKIKTVLQITTISLILIYLILDQAAFAHGWFYKIQNSYLGTINALMIMTVIITVSSGISYFKKQAQEYKAMKALSLALTSFLGVGFFPVAPGSMATAAGIGMIYLLHLPLFNYVALMLVLLVIAIPVCTYLEKVLNEKDPGIIVIDEVVGVMIALLGLPLTWPVVIIGFFLFRAFDMFKIYPINRLEALPGGWGIMLDDVMAGLYTNIALHLAIRYAGLT